MAAKILIFHLILPILILNTSESMNFDNGDCSFLIVWTLSSYSQWNEIYGYKINYLKEGVELIFYDEYLNYYELFFDYSPNDCIKLENTKFGELIKGHKFILKKKNCKEVNEILKINFKEYELYKNEILNRPFICRWDIIPPTRIFPNDKSKNNIKYFKDFPSPYYLGCIIDINTGKISQLDFSHSGISKKMVSKEQFVYLIQSLREFKFKFNKKQFKKNENEYFMTLPIIIRRKN